MAEEKEKEEAKKEEKTKSPRPKKVKTVSVTCHIPQLVNGKRGYVDSSGEIRWLAGLPASKETIEVSETDWLEAEFYKKVRVS